MKQENDRFSLGRNDSGIAAAPESCGMRMFFSPRGGMAAADETGSINRIGFWAALRRRPYRSAIKLSAIKTQRGFLVNG
jgi:hypothetical protein